MELKQLQTIKNILNEGSYLKAAEKMGYVPSTVTLHIQQLEDELGIKLFEKTGRRMVLSKEGDFFWTNAKPLLEHADFFKQTMNNFVTGQMGHIRLGTISTIGRSLLIPKVIAFCKKYPDMKLTFELNSSEIITQKIVNNQLDIAIGFAPPSNLNLYFEPICLEPMDLLLPVVQAGIGCSILPVAAIDPVPDLTVRRKLSNIEFGLMIGVIRRKEQLEKASERLYNELVYELKNRERQRS